MRGYFSINSTIKDRYIDIMFNAYWRDNLDIADEKILISLVESCKINPDQFLTAIKDPIIKDKLKDVTKDAHEKEPRSPRKVSSTPTYRNIALGFHVLCYGHLALL